MPRLREEADADRVENSIGTSVRKNELYPYELPCSVCGGVMYVDAETRERFNRAMEHDPDNQFTCDECESREDEMSHAAP